MTAIKREQAFDIVEVFARVDLKNSEREGGGADNILARQ